MSGPLAVVGKIQSISPIVGADRIQQATVDCGTAGRWSGVVGKDIQPEQSVIVFLQDAVLPVDDRWAFMEKLNWRVRMCRFKGVPSECLIVPGESGMAIGTDLTEALGVTKYEKPIPVGCAGDIKCGFPSWIPRTDEENFQRVPELVERMRSEPWYATEKADGTSSTAWVDADGLHVCSRNYELKEFTESGASNLFWRVARKYQMESFPQGYAIQFEIVGPGVQGNPMGLKENEIRAFTLWNRTRHERESGHELINFCEQHGLQVAWVTCAKVKKDRSWTVDDLRELANIKYQNGKPGEGIVIRSMSSGWSFKVINLNYKD